MRQGDYTPGIISMPPTKSLGSSLLMMRSASFGRRVTATYTSGGCSSNCGTRQDGLSPWHVLCYGAVVWHNTSARSRLEPNKAHQPAPAHSLPCMYQRASCGCHELGPLGTSLVTHRDAIWDGQVRARQHQPCRHVQRVGGAVVGTCVEGRQAQLQGAGDIVTT